MMEAMFFILISCFLLISGMYLIYWLIIEMLMTMVLEIIIGFYTDDSVIIG